MAKLYFYYSAMNAGKSTILLQSHYNYGERNMQTMLFVPDVDTRFHQGYIYSRIGLRAKAHRFNCNFNLLNAVKNKFYSVNKMLSCVLVDEAQFLSKEQVLQLTDIVEQLRIPVLAYGLRSDFVGEPFEGSKYLLILAEELVEIKTICHCGRKAIMNMRVNAKGEKITSGEQIKIGGNESYIATCRLHFKQGNSGKVFAQRRLEDSTSISPLHATID